ncbi:N-glycosylation domain-containing protein [Trichoderma sp. SZMC 28014]
MATATTPPPYEGSSTAPAVAPLHSLSITSAHPQARSSSALTDDQPSCAPPARTQSQPPSIIRRRFRSSSHLSAEKTTSAAASRDSATAGDAAAPAPSASALSSASSTSTPPMPTMLQPRVAVVLNVPKPWHPWLFALRLASILPALWWGLPSLLRLLIHFLPGPPDQFQLVRPLSGSCDAGSPDPLQTSALSSSCAGEQHGSATAAMMAAAPYAITETALATIWCFACGYLAFFFTDCLMSRWYICAISILSFWTPFPFTLAVYLPKLANIGFDFFRLIHYTPQATIVRLLSINAVNAYLTLTVLSLTGGFQDPRLLLPGWVSIATTLTICYHVTHQKINIRKETSTSVNVFSIASYITMVVLLAHMQTYQSDYPIMPVVSKSNHLWEEGKRLVAHAKALIHEYAER